MDDGFIGRAEETELDLVKDVLQCTTGDRGYGAVDSGNLELTIDRSRWCRAISQLHYDKFSLPHLIFTDMYKYLRELLHPDMFGQLRTRRMLA